MVFLVMLKIGKLAGYGMVRWKVYRKMLTPCCLLRVFKGITIWLNYFPLLRCGPSKGHIGVEPDPELWAPAPSSPWSPAASDGIEWGDGAEVRPSHRAAAPRHRETHWIQDLSAGVGVNGACWWDWGCFNLGLCQVAAPEAQRRRVSWGLGGNPVEVIRTALVGGSRDVAGDAGLESSGFGLPSRKALEPELHSSLFSGWLLAGPGTFTPVPQFPCP